MADPKLMHKFAFFLGDGASSENFAWLCGVNSRSVNFTNNTGEAVVLDCSDPMNVIPAMERWTISQDASLTVSGRAAKSSISKLRTWADTGEAQNIRLVVDETSADGGGHWQMPAILQGLEIGQEDKDSITFSATIVGAGRRSWTDAS